MGATSPSSSRSTSGSTGRAPAAEIERQVRAWRFHSLVPGDHGALAELDGETVRVLRVSLEPTNGRAVECGDGTIWIVETEAP